MHLVARKFLKRIDNHLSNLQKYKKIFNRNTVKVSYSCPFNIGSIILNQNKHKHIRNTRKTMQLQILKPLPSKQ